MTVRPLSAYDIALPVEGRKGLLTTIVRAGESDAKAGTTYFVCSTPEPDRALDVVRQDWRLRNFKANPVILDNHSHRMVVGRGENAKVPKTGEDAGNLTMTVRWDLQNPDVKVGAVGWQHLNGFRSAGSVGFSIGKMTMRNKLPVDHEFYSEGVEVESAWGTFKLVGRYLERNELLEFSSATIPMNPSALQRSFYEELSGHDIEDVVGRAEVVGETVPKAVASDLVAMVRALDGDQRADLVRELGDLLFPDVLQRMVRDEAARKAIQTAVALTPRPAEAPPEPPPPERRAPEWADGSSPVDHLFIVPSAG